MKKLVVHDIYRDGGTQICYDLKNPTTPYYIDRRIGSDTRDLLFDKYPGHEGAQIIKEEYKIYSPYK